MITTTITPTIFFTPDDSSLAKPKFLELLAIEQETWLIGFTVNMVELFPVVKALDTKGIPVHMLIDHIQYCGAHEKVLINDLYKNTNHCTIVIGTAGEPSKSTDEIIHMKSFVKKPTDGSIPMCWKGSWNFSDTANEEINECSYFNSQEYFDAFITIFNSHSAWNLQHHPNYQLTK